MQASSSSKTQPFVPNDLSFLFDDGPGQIQPPDGSVPLSDQHLFAHDPYAGTSAGGSYHDGRSESPGHDAGGSQSGSQTAEGSKTSGPRKSQRQPLSCTECTRRKTRCDKTIPCQNCIKRGKQSECHLEEVIKENPTTSRGPARHVQTQLDEIRTSTTSSIDQLSQRIHSLEGMFTTFIARFSADAPLPRPAAIPVYTPPAPAPLAQAIEAAAPLPEDFDDEMDPEADAAATLEYLSMGRSRAKSTGALVGMGPRGALEDDEVSESADGRSRASSAVPDHQQPTPGSSTTPQKALAAHLSSASSRPAGSKISSRQAGTKRPHRPIHAANLLKELPTELVGRRLVEYDMTMVSWLHAGYHGPTFAAECDLFWDEGSQGEVEVNKAWLALLFAVLASALLHLPSAEARELFPDEPAHSVLCRWFETIQQALHEYKWLQNHSLYTVQVFAISPSLFNHLGHSDLYFTQLAAAVKIAQTLNLNHLGADTYPNPQTAKQLDPRALIVREVCKRAWWQLVIQDLFHLPFNRSCSVSPRQFDTAFPLHCFDEALLDPQRLQPLSKEIPTSVSHTSQLIRFALLVFKLFDGLHSSGATIAYSSVLRMDEEANQLLAQAPQWLQLDDNENPMLLPPNAPAWLEWQRNAYLVSTAHKVIILHRPFLGRAFKDPRYKRSRDVCVSAARRILRLLRSYDFEPFRKTWTVLAHSTAASVILVMEYAHSAGSVGGSPAAASEDSLQLVNDVISIFEGLKGSSTIAAKAVIVLRSLVEETLRKVGGGGGTGNGGKRKAEGELKRAVKVLRRTNSSSSSQHTAGAAPAETSPSSLPDFATTYAPLTPSFLSFGYESTPKLAATTMALPPGLDYAPFSGLPNLGGSGPLDANLAAFHGRDFATLALSHDIQPQFNDDEFEFMLRDFDLGHGVSF